MELRIITYKDIGVELKINKTLPPCPGCTTSLPAKHDKIVVPLVWNAPEASMPVQARDILMLTDGNLYCQKGYLSFENKFYNDRNDKLEHVRYWAYPPKPPKLIRENDEDK